MNALLEVKELCAGYGEFQVLWGVDLSVKSQSMSIGIIGSNGAGKTTLMRCIAGLIEPFSGIISFKGLELNKLNAETRVNLGISYAPSEKELFPKMKVIETLEVGAFNKRARDKMEENLDLVFSIFPRLREKRNQKAGTLSGGEQQMLAIGRALMTSPELLLLDEPSSGLAPILVGELFTSLRNLKGKKLFAIILVEQKVSLALDFSDYVYVMENGKITVSGSPIQMRENPLVRKAYLGAV